LDLPDEKSSFECLYSILQPRLDAQFLPKGGGARGSDSSSTYIITTKIRLIIVLRYFAGGSVYNIMLVHGVSLQSVYNSIWGVVDVINVTAKLKYQVPDHEQQREIAAGFCAQSEAGFDSVVGAIDGLVVCTIMLTLSECKHMNCGQANFRCHQKDKYGLNLQAICEHNLKFWGVEMKWSAATSNYMAWVTLSLNIELENNVGKFIREVLSLAIAQM
jgi:hypothetical protein